MEPLLSTEQITEQPTFSVGGALRDARQQLGLSIDEVAGRTKFAPRQIEALEADNFADLPEPAFVRGFVRSYARLVQLDAAALVAALPLPAAPSAVEPAKRSESVPLPASGQPRWKKWLLLEALAVLLLLAGFLLTRSSDAPPAAPAPADETIAPPVGIVSSPIALPLPAEPVAPATSAVTASSAVAAASAVVSSEPPLKLMFDEKSWAEVRDGSRKVLFSKVGAAGSEQSIAGAPPFTLVIGHASGVRVTYRGQFVDLTPYTSNEIARFTLE